MALKTYTKLKSEIATKKIEAGKPKHSPGLMNEMQSLIADLYEKIDNLNERLNIQEIP